MENNLICKESAVKLFVKNGWISCPCCRRNTRLMRVLPETEAKCLVVFCRNCKREMILNIDKGQRVELRSQEPP